MASISEAWSGEKNPSVAGRPDLARAWACSWAARMPGQCVASQIELRPESEPTSTDRRECPCFSSCLFSMGILVSARIPPAMLGFKQWLESIGFLFGSATKAEHKPFRHEPELAIRRKLTR